MKRIYETFTDEEHAALVEAKGKLTWHDFILTLLTTTRDEKEEQ